MANIDDDLCCGVVATRCTHDAVLISLNVLPERYGLQIAAVPERFGVTGCKTRGEGPQLNMTNAFGRAAC